ncbi:MAG: transposase [Atopobiaceae bacterium]|nr:transposase [Atopobiaceae bacterium]
MPGRMRRASESGFHHVVTKGNADQIIFEDEIDRKAYVELLRRATERDGLAICAWCLMANHVHLVVEDPEGRLSSGMWFVNHGYSKYFNERAGRSGHLFKERFWSEPIEDDGYLLRAVRYFHQNPQVAGVCAQQDYSWSSYHEYIGSPDVADTSLVLEMLGDVEGFREFAEERMEASPFPGSSLRGHLRYDELVLLARAAAGVDDLAELSRMGVDERRRALASLRDAGMTITQMARLTGLGRSSVYFALE